MSDSQLIDAVRSGDLKALEHALEGGGEVDAQDGQGWTALKWAAGSGDAAMVELLLTRGADAGLSGRDGRTPLRVAQAAGHRKVERLLEEASARVGEAGKRPYCRAFYLQDLQRFEGWPQAFEGKAGVQGEGSGQSIVYIHQDFTVTRSIWHGEDILFDGAEPGWPQFCEQELGFTVPEHLPAAVP